MSGTIHADICVVGAGPVGGTLACRLAAEGISTAIVDRAPLPPMEHPAFDGRAYAIAAGSRRLLEAAGLWEKLPDPPCPILGIRVSDGRVGQAASPLFLHFDHTEAGEGAGPFGWMVEARALRVALNAHLHALPALSVFAPAEARVERDGAGARVHVAGGPTVACKLVVAAEGRNSPLREAARIPVSRFAYRQTGLVFAISHERPHGSTALEHFLPSGPFAQLPMSPTEGAPHVSAVVWTELTPVAHHMLRLDDAALGREIARRLGPHLGAVRVIGRRWHYGLSAMHAHRYHDTRLVLVGDAAHGIHPIAGQGLNLGFRDVQALSRLLTEAVWGGGDPGDPALLARYQAARRPANLAMLAATDALDRLFSTDNLLLRAARDVGIAAVHRLPPLKRAFMRAAMGLSGAA
ncbi:MAG: UbiH/UbiF/VisC/COQ6 family ubiquinone biosynthesis hydroxylase [Acetobacteraceae bacterium]|nr:UbiH/UbiF/VisC/COQ6 family ubiquinone biosynthesis hydroxylase [Acetobacteraceae bacterium]